VGAYVAAIFAAEIGNLVGGKTRLDILLVPASSILAGATMGVLVGPPVARFMIMLGQIVNDLTALGLSQWNRGLRGYGDRPDFAISSAALSIMLGCRDWRRVPAQRGVRAHGRLCRSRASGTTNSRGLLAQGVGKPPCCSMPNIMLRPQIAVPAVVASVVTGPLSTLVF
jgi:uncharacterized membrane protein